MKRTIQRVAGLLNILLLVMISGQSMAENYSNEQQIKNCDFTRSGEWWKNDFSSLPADVSITPETNDTEFCDFYQFSLDYFLFMISKNQNGSAEYANFLNQSLFPLLETTGTDSCDDTYPANAFNVRTSKSPTDDSPFVLPERIDQAFAQSIYDQNGKVVFYEIRFTRNLCDYQKILSKPNFPGKTVELKMAWKILGKGDNKDNFYQINADIKDHEGKTHNFDLGLVGMHLAIAADNHPEMVWVTIEQEDNTIACNTMKKGQSAHSFISQTCASGGSCNQLNKTIAFEGISIDSDKANDICEEFVWGTVEGQSKTSNDYLNIALLEKLNTTFVDMVAGNNSQAPDYLKLWANYRIKGALWVSDIDEDSIKSNQRGSLELANTVMETQFQGTFNKPDSSFNCFGCHNYSGTESNTEESKDNPDFGLSHIFDDIIKGQQKKK